MADPTAASAAAPNPVVFFDLTLGGAYIDSSCLLVIFQSEKSHRKIVLE